MYELLTCNSAIYGVAIKFRDIYFQGENVTPLEKVGLLYWFEFGEYYAFDLQTMFDALDLKVPEKMLLEWYEMEVPRKINLRNFYMIKKSKKRK